ncbi:hypothetical protein ABXV18_26885, partial [Vibrio owensii]|uniref:hypothetical protein n=1 Tax=Vibrio owensii TaxID=696485 RepID=UPI003390B89A
MKKTILALAVATSLGASMGAAQASQLGEQLPASKADFVKGWMKENYIHEDKNGNGEIDHGEKISFGHNEDRSFYMYSVGTGFGYVYFDHPDSEAWRLEVDRNQDGSWTITPVEPSAKPSDDFDPVTLHPEDLTGEYLKKVFDDKINLDIDGLVDVLKNWRENSQTITWRDLTDEEKDIVKANLPSEVDPQVRKVLKDHFMSKHDGSKAKKLKELMGGDFALTPKQKETYAAILTSDLPLEYKWSVVKSMAVNNATDYDIIKYLEGNEQFKAAYPDLFDDNGKATKELKDTVSAKRDAKWKETTGASYTELAKAVEGMGDPVKQQEVINMLASLETNTGKSLLDDMQNNGHLKGKEPTYTIDIGKRLEDNKRKIRDKWQKIDPLPDFTSPDGVKLFLTQEVKEWKNSKTESELFAILKTRVDDHAANWLLDLDENGNLVFSNESGEEFVLTPDEFKSKMAQGQKERAERRQLRGGDLPPVRFSDETKLKVATYLLDLSDINASLSGTELTFNHPEHGQMTVDLATISDDALEKVKAGIKQEAIEGIAERRKNQPIVDPKPVPITDKVAMANAMFEYFGANAHITESADGSHHLVWNGGSVKLEDLDEAGLDDIKQRVREELANPDIIIDPKPVPVEQKIAMANEMLEHFGTNAHITESADGSHHLVWNGGSVKLEDLDEAGLDDIKQRVREELSNPDFGIDPKPVPIEQKIAMANEMLEHFGTNAHITESADGSHHLVW